MKIAITDLKDYNEAILRYEWLDLEQCSSKDDIAAFIQNFLDKRSKETGELHEEWFVTDYEEFTNLGEYPDLDDVEQAVKLSLEHGWEVVAVYYGMNQNFDDFEESFNGIHDNEEDFAYDIANDIYSEEQLGVLSSYIDWEKYARDLFISDYYSEELGGGEVAVFRRM
jgi:antirestriction protein